LEEKDQGGVGENPPREEVARVERLAGLVGVVFTEGKKEVIHFL
jgi:hypothetical protein